MLDIYNDYFNTSTPSTALGKKISVKNDDGLHDNVDRGVASKEYVTEWDIQLFEDAVHWHLMVISQMLFVSVLMELY